MFEHQALPHEERPERWAEDDTAFRWRCECGARGRLWEDRRRDATDGHRAHQRRQGVKT